MREPSIGAVQVEQPPQLTEWLRMIDHAEIDDAVAPRRAGRLRRPDEQPRRLPTTCVAALALGGVERGQEPVGEWPTGRLEGGDHRAPAGVAPRHVPLRAAA